jgi:hypothetical protein
MDLTTFFLISFNVLIKKILYEKLVISINTLKHNCASIIEASNKGTLKQLTRNTCTKCRLSKCNCKLIVNTCNTAHKITKGWIIRTLLYM